MVAQAMAGVAGNAPLDAPPATHPNRIPLQRRIGVIIALEKIQSIECAPAVSPVPKLDRCDVWKLRSWWWKLLAAVVASTKHCERRCNRTACN